MKQHFIGYLLLLAFFVSSCQKEVQVEIPNSKNKIVLNCIMNEDSLFTVLVSRTKKLYVDDNVDMALTNATVSVYENGVLIENLSHDSIGIYSSKTFKPKVGNKY
jgi:transposase